MQEEMSTIEVITLHIGGSDLPLRFIAPLGEENLYIRNHKVVSRRSAARLLKQNRTVPVDVDVREHLMRVVSCRLPTTTGFPCRVCSKYTVNVRRIMLYFPG